MKALVQFFAISILLGTSILSSCTDEITSDKSVPSNNNEYAEMTNTEIKKEFGAALAKVLAESAPVRELIKKEALRKIDYDYDVLYLMVKDEKLSDNTTLENLLLNYVTPDFLSLLEVKIPNLTIFVPELPFESFSAETWNTITEIPVVGIRTLETNNVPVFDGKGRESVITAEYIPAYPIVVVKENERIVVKNPSTKSSAQTVLTKSALGLELTFLDNVFNNVDRKKSANNDKENYFLLTKSRVPEIPDNIKKLFDAYDIYANTAGWQRDYIYYDIKPDKTRGPINLKFKECLVGFELRGNPKTTLNKIADQTGDPKLDPNYKHYNNMGYNYTGWDDGEFEFEVNVYLGGTFPELKTYIRLKPNSLFKITLSGTPGKYKIAKVEFADDRVPLNIPLFEWDLEKYSSTIKIAISEFDESEVIKRSTSMTTKYATNFGYDTSIGDKVKIGMKFGSTTETTNTSTFEVTTTKNSDSLGEVLVNFGDEVLLDKENIGSSGRGANRVFYPNYNTKYYNDYYRLYIAPVKVN